MLSTGCSKASWRSSRATNLAAHLVSIFSAYVNGEVVVIDGGEWLKGADIQPARSIPEELWDQLEMMIKARINKIKERLTTKTPLFYY
jgi:hypothetical protein